MLTVLPSDSNKGVPGTFGKGYKDILGTQILQGRLELTKQNERIAGHYLGMMLSLGILLIQSLPVVLD